MPRKARVPALSHTKIVNGRIWLYENERLVMELKAGDKFLGSKVTKSGTWAVCQSCGARHSIGVACASCQKDRDRKKREHKDIKKPEIKGI
jgi:hypothetical protein